MFKGPRAFKGAPEIERVTPHFTLLTPVNVVTGALSTSWSSMIKPVRLSIKKTLCEIWMTTELQTLYSHCVLCSKWRAVFHSATYILVYYQIIWSYQSRTVPLHFSLVTAVSIYTKQTLIYHCNILLNLWKYSIHCGRDFCPAVVFHKFVFDWMLVCHQSCVFPFSFHVLLMYFPFLPSSNMYELKVYCNNHRNTINIKHV